METTENTKNKKENPSIGSIVENAIAAGGRIIIEFGVRKDDALEKMANELSWMHSLLDAFVNQKGDIKVLSSPGEQLKSISNMGNKKSLLVEPKNDDNDVMIGNDDDMEGEELEGWDRFFVIDLSHIINCISNMSQGMATIDDMIDTFVKAVVRDGKSTVYGWIFVPYCYKPKAFDTRRIIQERLKQNGVGVGEFHVWNTQTRDDDRKWKDTEVRKHTDVDVYVVHKIDEVIHEYGPGIKIMYLVSGDKHMIPGIQTALDAGVTVKAISFDSAMSNEVSHMVGKENTIIIV